MNIMTLSAFLLITGAGAAGARGGDSSEAFEAQQSKVRITGTIVDQAGEPVIGANIVEKGVAANGTITDVYGKFNLDVSPGATLVVSYIGYVTQEIAVGNRTELRITLQEDLQALEEVVVVGYGVQKKSDVTGAVLRVSEETLQSRPVNNVLQGMQGKVAGVDITSNERPGTVGAVYIRGVRSLTASNSPLYVVDGIPLMTGGIEYINPNDIESVDVLKDASATAIYGSRGANGVIIVTTKSGKSGRLTLNYSGSVTAETLEDYHEMMTASEYIDWRRWAYYYSNPDNFPRGDQPTQENDFRIFLGASDPASWANVMKGWQSGSWDGSKVPTTDWIGMVTQTGITNQHTLSASGGTQAMKGYVSFGYTDNKGTVRGQEYTRYTAKATLDITPVKWFTIGGNINASYAIQEYGQSSTGNLSPGNYYGTDDLYSMAKANLPWAVPYDEQGNVILYPGGDNSSKTIVNEWEYSQDQRVTLRTFGSFFGQIDFGKMASALEGLKFRLNFGPDFSFYRDGVYLDAASVNRLGSSHAALTKNQTVSYTLDNLLYYDKTVGKHGIGVTLLQSQTKYDYENSSMSANDIPLSSQKWNALTTGNIPSLLSWSSGLTQRQLMSYMGRLNYSFANRYLLTLSGRWDGASQLAEGHKWSFFPSAALGWRLDQEGFLAGVDYISQLKLRAGVGATGNAAIDPYVTKGNVGSMFYPYGTTLIPGSYPSSTMANLNLGWERTIQYNVGIDFSLWEGRVSGVLDVYTSHTSDLLMQMTVPSVTGYTSTYANIGETANKGFDLTLSAVNIDLQDFRWTTDLSLAWQKDRIVSLANGKEDDISNNWFIGKPNGVIYGYQSNGLWQASDEAEMQKFNANGYKFSAGLVRPVDQDADYMIDANHDRVIVGNTRPNWITGMTNTFAYKGIELSVFLFGRLGYWYNTEGESQTGRFSQRRIDYYTENHTDAEYQKPIYGQAAGDPYYPVLGYRKASFIKVRNISLGYNFPARTIRGWGFSSLKLYGQILNPGMLYSQIDFLDMDVSRSIWQRGFTFGLNIGF
ncbi:MAG: TonB-dependent receptor [Tannerella sp.]|nr:TonB-dependent receptor [Tannerella sp.]